MKAWGIGIVALSLWLVHAVAGAAVRTDFQDSSAASQTEAVLNFRLHNDGPSALTNPSILYEFTIEPYRTPAIDIYNAPGATARIELIEGYRYRLVLQFSNLTIAAGAVAPSSSSQYSVRLRYSDYSYWLKNNDYAYNGNTGAWVENARIVVKDAQGNVVGGTPNPNSGTSFAAPVPRVWFTEGTYTSTNQSNPQLTIENQSGGPLYDVYVDYYFTIENGKTPVADDYYTPDSGLRLESLGNSQYRLTYDFMGVTANPGETLPHYAPNTVGLHYGDWSSWSKTNDWSQTGNGARVIDDHIVVRNAQGTVLYGTAPSVQTPPPATSADLHVYLQETGGLDSSATKPRIKIQNTGTGSVTGGFKLYYYVKADAGKTPVLDDWYTPYSTLSLVNVGNGIYRVVEDYAGVTLGPGQTLPNDSGDSLGLHYSDWSSWSRTDDPSYVDSSGLFKAAPNIPVYSSTGTLLAGNDPYGTTAPSDRDGDGVPDSTDAFPDNPSESADLDHDGIGDNSDTDRDGDGVANAADAFPNDPAESSDLDHDGIGDNADTDRDGDGVPNGSDAFPSDPAESSDLDHDGIGDNADTDRDGDGVLNASDAFPNDPAESSDLDHDGVGDNADTDRDGDGVLNASDAFPSNPSESSDLDHDGIGDNSDTDRDGDGVANASDAFPNDPAESSDLDHDGVGDNADTDRDGDGVPNGSDAFPSDPSESSDLDQDGIGDNSDTDRDGDGVANASDAFPNDPAESSDLDHDGVGDNADTDRDGDGVPNASDAFPSNPSESSDLDHDGIGDNADTDRDGDGVLNASDAFPNDPAESSDLDHDGVGDNADTDRDGDGVLNAYDAFPTNPSESSDLDHDGVGDNSDTDRDGDGVANAADAFPNDPAESSDLDHDGIGDNADTDRDGDGVSNPSDAFPSDPAEASDLDHDGIGDHADTDRDGDGVANADDPYPDDPSLSRPPPPGALTADVQGKAVALSWTPDARSTAGTRYTVERGSAPDFAFLQITDAPIELALWTDDTAPNGSGNRYRVIAVDPAGRGSEPSATADAFVAWHDEPVTGLAAERHDGAVVLSWQGAQSDAFRLERALSGGGFTTLAEVGAAQASDATLDWPAAAQYRVTGLRRFLNPFTGQTEERSAPASAALAVEALAPLTLSVEGATQSNGVWHLPPPRGDSVALGGRYMPADASVAITASGSGQTFQSSAVAGEYAFELPAATASWTLSVQDIDYASRRASLALTIDRDTERPTVVLDAVAASTTDETIMLSGSASDAQTDLATLVAHSDRYPGVNFAVTRVPSGRFDADVPLLAGANGLSVVATDGAGNSASVSAAVQRDSTAAPVLRILAPANSTRITADRVDLVVEVASSVSPDQLRVVFRDQVYFAGAAVSPGLYRFTFAGAKLTEGINTLTVSALTPAGSAEASVSVVQGAEEQTPTAAPSIRILFPAAGRLLSSSPVTLAGEVSVSIPPLTLSADGVPVSVVARSSTLASFQLPMEVQGQRQVQLVATDGLNQATTLTATLVVDDQAPELSVQGLSPAPAVNAVHDRPYHLVGSAHDTHLAGVAVNGTPVSLTPDGSGHYGFDLPLTLAGGEDTSIDVLAWDAAGAQTQHRYILRPEHGSALDVVQPVDGATVSLTQRPGVIATRVRRLSDDVAAVTVDAGGEPVSLGRDGAVFGGDIAVGTDGSSASLRFSAYDDTGTLIDRVSVAVTLDLLAERPLTLTGTEPANGAPDTRPNQAITLAFDRAIDPAQVAISVRETVHGLSYDTRTPLPSDIPVLDNLEPVRVDRDLEAVPGVASALPGRTTLAWYPARDFAYGSRILVEVTYANEDLGRFEFFVRDLPSFAQGSVGEPTGNALKGIRVELPSLGLSTTTDGNGNFSFGSGEDLNAKLPAGRHDLVINPGFGEPRFGQIRRKILVEGGQVNRLGVYPLPFLTPDIPFVRLDGGHASQRLAQGELSWDFTNARLVFPDGRLGGDVHSQFVTRTVAGLPSSPEAPAAWLYLAQPSGIKIEGAASVRLHLPSEYGAYGYVPPDGTRVLLVGWDPDTDRLMPMGVGRIRDTEYVQSERLELKVLDALGVSFARFDEGYEQALADYAQGQINLNQLTQRLRQEPGEE